MNMLPRLLKDLTELLFPSLCVTCGDRLISQDRFLCLNCWHDLPVTNYHEYPDNKVAQLFWGRVHIECATSFFAYKKGSRYQNLIHEIKYKGLKELGIEAGRRFGFVLKESKAFQLVDLIVPVPLHPMKEKSRGFNQSDLIAKGIAEVLKIPLSTHNLYRNTFTSTQTKKNRFERWKNVENVFGINDAEEMHSKHILLIDDVTTTGSTLEACAYQILKQTDTKVSIATLAFADF